MVRVEDRGEGKFDTLTKALNLASYTIDITDNKNVFVPEHESTTEKLVFLATDIYHKARVANDIKVEGKEELLLERRRLQNEAIEECEQLLSTIQIAKLVFHLRTKRVKYWGGKVEELKGYLRKWRESDADRFRKKR